MAGLVQAHREVSQRKVRQGLVNALETIEQHAAVINGQGYKLKGLGEALADALTRLDAAEKRIVALEVAQRQRDGMEAA